MDKPSAPQPPDFTAAAQATGQGNVQGAIANALLSQKNQVTPFGSLSYAKTGSTTIPGTARAGTPAQQQWIPATMDHGTGSPATPGHWQAIPGTATPAVAGTSSTTIPQFTATTTLDPKLQGTVDSLMGQAQTSLSSPLSLPTASSSYNQKVADALYGRATSYLDPQWQQDETKQRDLLANQGFSTGSAGYTNAMGDFQRSKDQAYANARDSAIYQGANTGLAQNQQDVSNILAERNAPLAELTSIRTGAMPSFGATPAQGIGGIDYSGAALNQASAANQGYNVQAGEFNSQQQGLYGLGSAGLMAYLYGGGAGAAAAAPTGAALLGGAALSAA